MNVSIVIPDSNDLRIENCINSIDENVEVVISLNKPSKKLKLLIDKILYEQKNNYRYENLRFIICQIEIASIALAYNNGIKNAKYKNILLMDSDCTFKKGTIGKLYLNLGDNLLSKGRVIFKQKSLQSKITAKARDYKISKTVNAYSPPLLFKKQIINYIGRYYFHPKLCWLEDSEFDARVRKAKLNISYDKSAVIFHDQLSFAKDLKSSFLYGVGKRIGVEVGVHDIPLGLMGSFKKYFINLWKEDEFLLGLYLFIWKIAFLSGYTCQALIKIR